MMNKTWTVLILTMVFYGSKTFCAMNYGERSPWTGFYVGGNAGYLWSAGNTILNKGESTFANPLFLPNSRSIANSLATLGSNKSSNSLKNFIAGAQIGYNSHFSERLVIGLDADLDALGQAHNTSYAVKTVSTPLLGTHTAEIAFTKKLSYIGLLKGRLGFLISPTILVYGSGAFAYGGASLKTIYNVTGSQTVFLPIHDQTNINSILAGWAAGAGAEWLFAPCWSVKAEYIYYELGPLDSHFDLNQNIATVPVAAFSRININSKTRFTENTFRVGVNYHFG